MRVAFFSFLLLLVPSVLAAPITTTEPLAFFTLTPQAGKTGAVFTADASTSRASVGGGNLTYEWSWGENATFVNGSTIETHVYRQEGRYVVALRVSDTTGKSANATQTVLVQGARAEAYFTVSTSKVAGGTLAHANATFSQPSKGARRVVRYEWRWGDGAGFAQGNVTEDHVFRDAGTFLVTLRVTDDQNRTDEGNEPVVIGSTFLQRLGRVWHDRDSFLKGTYLTLELAVLAVVVGFILAVIVALLRISRSPILSWPAAVYVEVLRGTPLLVQILIAWLVLPYIGIKLTTFWAGAIALIVNTSAYQSEVIRAGIQSIPSGQLEAALALGMTRTQALRHVVLPQALRLIIPPLGNEFIILLKDTSLVSVIGVVELTQVGRIFSARTFLVLETWLGVAAVYFVMTYTLSIVLRRLEKKLRIPGLGIEGVAH